jgi:hypothetical protein
VERVSSVLRVEKSQPCFIDFEKIIPMPEGVFRGNLGEKERQLYGKNNWYDWSTANWATKWNSATMDDPHVYNGGNCIEFLTAWSSQEPVIQRLSELYPDAQFRIAWADEDIGSNVGEKLWKNGDELEWDVPTSWSKEAYEMAAEILGVSLSEYNLYYNAKSGNYEHRENEAEPEETVHIGDRHTSPDFQCDLTSGYIDQRRFWKPVIIYDSPN